MLKGLGLMTPAILAGVVAVRSTWLGQVRYAVPPLVWRGTSLACHMWSVGDLQICRRPIPAGETPVMASTRDRRPVAWRRRQVLQGPACRFLRVPGGAQECGR